MTAATATPAGRAPATTAPTASATAAPAYWTRTADLEADRDAILALWDGQFCPRAMQPAKYRHFYRDCPHGPPLVQVLCHADGAGLVGVIAAGARPMHWQGRVLRAGVVSHFAVAAPHRSLGPALMLQQALVEAAHGRFDLLYGLPRPGAVGVSRRSGFVELGTLERHAKVLRHGPYLRRRLPAAVAQPLGALVDASIVLRERLADGFAAGLRWRWAEASEPAIDGLWRASAAPDALTAVRDHASVRWRFDLPPGGRARHLMVDDAAGRLVGWFACDAEDAPDDPLRVLDYWALDATRGLSRALVRALAAAARAQRRPAIHLLLAATPPALEAWREEGYVVRDGQPVIGRWLDDSLVPDGPPGLHLTWIDQDG